MRVFLTGATGYVATAIAAELPEAGHTVLGLARSDKGAADLKAQGLEPHRGELADHQSLIAGAAASDGVVHCAFIDDFSRFMENAEIERAEAAEMLASRPTPPGLLADIEGPIYDDSSSKYAA